MKLFSFGNETAVAQEQQPSITPRHQQGLLLTGGGARAAYQIGVLKAIGDLIPRNHPIPFPIICGTSAGAINATSLACYASCYHLGIRKLEHVWRNFKSDQVYNTSLGGSLSHLFGYYFKSSKHNTSSVGKSIIDNSPLSELLDNLIEYPRIQRNIDKHQLQAVSVNASCYNTHQSVSFFQAQDSISEWTRAKRKGNRSQLTTSHLLASSAIPFIFPSRKLDNSYFCDGSINQLSPLSAPIHLGASKVLVIGVDPDDPQSNRPLHEYPDNSAIISHLLDTVFGDTLLSDIERVKRVNHTLATLNDEQRKQLNLRTVDHLVITPSENINAIATHYYQKLPLATKLLLRTLGVTKKSNTSILSYLMFESEYCQQLIALGYKDGKAKQHQFKEFLHL